MVAGVKSFARQLLHRFDSRAGELVPGPYRETVQVVVPSGLAYHEFLFFGNSGGPADSHGSPKDSEYPYSSVMMDDLTNFV